MVDNTVLMEGVRIIFRNFAGKEGKYNQEGDRNFAVLLDDNVADDMEKDDWAVKRLKPREDDEEPHEQAYLPVSIKYRNRAGQTVRPARIVVITSRGRTNISEDEIEILDWADIENVDLIVRPFAWNVNGKGGIKAYLQSMYVTIREDPLELKYSELDVIPTRSGQVDE
jgi:hypothetical protein